MKRYQPPSGPFLPLRYIDQITPSSITKAPLPSNSPPYHSKPNMSEPQPHQKTPPFPLPTYTNPHTSAASDPTNIYLTNLRDNLDELSNAITHLRNLLHQKHTRFETWEKKTREVLGHRGLDAEEVEERMQRMYEGKVKEAWRDAGWRARVVEVYGRMDGGDEGRWGGGMDHRGIECGREMT